MRILSWVQSKINGRIEQKKPDLGYTNAAHYHNIQHSNKEEFSDWPQALLAIGTFGNSELKVDSSKEKPLGMSNQSTKADAPNFTFDEAAMLQKEVAELLAKSASSELEFKNKVRLDHHPPNLDISQTTPPQGRNCSDNGNDDDVSPKSRIILNRAKDILTENHTINKKSLSFLLKKMVSCRGGFTPAVSLRDPVQETIMEKLTKAILHKKIYPQNPSPTSTRKYLNKKPMEEGDCENKMQKKKDDGSKWVKTDSDFIVLEI